MILQYLDFERPIVDLENRLEQLRRLDDGTDKNLREEEGKLEKKIAKIRKVIFIGQQKGRNTTEKIRRNFGMAHPEGYRKALRLMKLGEKFRLPVITVIDTPGAFPGIGAEERGQSEAIARNLIEMAKLNTPLVVVVIGEGGSGGGRGVGGAGGGP